MGAPGFSIAAIALVIIPLSLAAAEEAQAPSPYQSDAILSNEPVRAPDGGVPGEILFEFVEQNCGDILYAFSRYSGISIIGDDTVSGKTSFRFSGSSFEQAFDAFLLVNRLYVSKDGKTWTVSRICLTREGADGEISIDAIDVPAARILEGISSFAELAIVGEILPADRISLHASGTSAEDLARMAIRAFPGFSVEREQKNLRIRRGIDGAAQPAGNPRMCLSGDGKSWTLEVTQATAGEVIDRISREESTGYSSFIKNQTALSGIRVSSGSLDGIIAAVEEQAGAECILRNGVRYWLPAQGTDAAKRIREEGCVWETFTTASIRMDRALPLLQSRFPAIQFVQVNAADSCMAKVSPAQASLVAEYISLIDRPEPRDIIRLKYISTQDFLKSLPPSAKREDIADTGTGNSFFYSAPRMAREGLVAALKEIDVPKPRIRYDMLIIQYDKSSSLSWGSSAGIRRMQPGDTTAITGTFGSLLDINFDVITVFGYNFSARLSAALSENRAQVFADTTLHGISGENVKFQNTSTYRYRDSNVDAETGKTIYTGITREIVSGVVLEVNGWVSGDGMVTMAISASVSKRGADISSANGNPPPTSEKLISTRLSTQDGEPVILSGLEQNDSSIVERRLPFISKIPIIGWFFRDYTATRQKSEMVIYLVPHITNGRDKADERDALEATAVARLVVPRGGEAE